MGYYLLHSENPKLCVTRNTKHPAERVLEADVEGACVGIPINTLGNVATVH